MEVTGPFLCLKIADDRRDPIRSQSDGEINRTWPEKKKKKRASKMERGKKRSNKRTNLTMGKRDREALNRISISMEKSFCFFESGTREKSPEIIEDRTEEARTFILVAPSDLILLSFSVSFSQLKKRRRFHVSFNHFFRFLSSLSPSF